MVDRDQTLFVGFIISTVFLHYETQTSHFLCMETLIVVSPSGEISPHLSSHVWEEEKCPQM